MLTLPLHPLPSRTRSRLERVTPPLPIAPRYDDRLWRRSDAEGGRVAARGRRAVQDRADGAWRVLADRGRRSLADGLDRRRPARCGLCGVETRLSRGRTRWRGLSRHGTRYRARRRRATRPPRAFRPETPPAHRGGAD